MPLELGGKAQAIVRSIGSLGRVSICGRNTGFIWPVSGVLPCLGLASGRKVGGGGLVSV